MLKQRPSNAQFWGSLEHLKFKRVGLGWAVEGPDPPPAAIRANGAFCALRRRHLLADVSDVRLNKHKSDSM